MYIYIYTESYMCTKCIITRLAWCFRCTHSVQQHLYLASCNHVHLEQVYAVDGHVQRGCCVSGEERQAQNRLRDDHPATLYPNFPLQPGEAWHFDCRLLQVCNIWTPHGHLRRICGDVKGYSLCRCCPLTWWFHLVTSLQAWSYNLLYFQSRLEYYWNYIWIGLYRARLYRLD